MKNNLITMVMAVLVLALFPNAAFSHGEGGKNVKLHVNPKWSQCSLQLDASLTQEAWHQFTEEAGLVAYFRPLTDAKPIGVGTYELSILNWQTKIDDTKSAWNDTFVHPDSTHWLIEGDRLPIPGLMFRTGVTDKIDASAYWIKNPGSNYGFWGGQVQYNFVNDPQNNWAASTRVSFVSLYGPDDLGLTVYGAELLASKEYGVFSDWASISPYAGISTYLSRSAETSAVVDLQDENIFGVRGMAGAVAQISMVRLAAEYNVAKVQSLSFKLGVDF